MNHHHLLAPARPRIPLILSRTLRTNCWASSHALSCANCPKSPRVALQSLAHHLDSPLTLPLPHLTGQQCLTSSSPAKEK